MDWSTIRAAKPAVLLLIMISSSTIVGVISMADIFTMAVQDMLLIIQTSMLVLNDQQIMGFQLKGLFIR